jgi:hypothetical protein
VWDSPACFEVLQRPDPTAGLAKAPSFSRADIPLSKLEAYGEETLLAH